MSFLFLHNAYDSNRYFLLNGLTAVNERFFYALRVRNSITVGFLLNHLVNVFASLYYKMMDPIDSDLVVVGFLKTV